MINYSLITDEELVTFFCAGQNEAFDELLLRYKDKLYSYISYIVKNDDVADDLFQETFVKAIVTLRQGKYQENGKFYAWLTRIAHNLLIDQFRNEKSENITYHQDEESNLCDNGSLLVFNRENEIIQEQMLKEVKLIVDRLPTNQREVVFMRYYQDLSFKEIADITGVSINTALGRMHYAILNMKRMAKHIGIAAD